MKDTKNNAYFKIKEGTIYSSLVDGDLALLDRALSVKHPKAKQIKFNAFKKHQAWANTWDGKIHFLKRPSNQFPSGLLRVLPDLLKKNGIENFDIDTIPSKRRIDIDESLLDLVDENFLEGITLRKYQVKAARDMLRENRGIAHCATNSGKTEIAISIIKFITLFLEEVSGESKSILLVNNLDLLYQTKERILKRWPLADVGLVGHGHFESDKKVIVATAQTIASRLRSKKKKDNAKCRKLLKDTTILVLDECHHTRSNTWKEIANKCHASFRYGLSGTALNRQGIEGLRNLELMSITGKVLSTVSNKFLIEQGYSARPIIHLESIGEHEKDVDLKSLGMQPNPRTPCKILTESGGWTSGIFLKREVKKGKPTGKSLIEANGSQNMVLSDYIVTECYYDRAIVDYEPRNQAILEWSLQFSHDDKPTLAIVKKKVHGRLLEHKLINAGLEAKFIFGDTTPQERIEAREDLSCGNLDILIATSIFDEGVDAPDIRAMIIAAASKSYDKNLQRVGRGLRKKKEDNTVVIIDFIDFQHPNTLEASLQRLEDYESEEFDIQES